MGLTRLQIRMLKAALADQTDRDVREVMRQVVDTSSPEELEHYRSLLYAAGAEFRELVADPGVTA